VRDISFNITTNNIVVKCIRNTVAFMKLYATFTFNLQLSCFDLQVCHVALAQVTYASFLANVTCANDFHKKLSYVS